MDANTLNQKGPWTKKKIEAMITKFSETFAIIMLKKHRKCCKRGLTHFDATPIFKKLIRYIWATLYNGKKIAWIPQFNTVFYIFIHMN